MTEAGKFDFSALEDRWRRRAEENQRRSREARQRLIRKGVPVFQRFGVKKVVLFGSVLEGRMRPGSDIDIMVDHVAPEQFFRFMAELSEALDLDVDIHTMDEDTIFTRKMQERGEVVYDEDSGAA